MKKILTGILLLSAYLSPAQTLSVGAGLGMSDKGDVVQLKINAEADKVLYVKNIGITTGYYHVSESKVNTSGYFNFELFKSIYLDDYTKLIIKGGWAYKRKDSNIKTIEGWKEIFGAELNFKIWMSKKIGGRVWMGASFVDNTKMFTLGLRVASNKECKCNPKK